MVYKDGKYASYGGHTVRGCGNKHAKYRRASFIVRSAGWHWSELEPTHITRKDVSDGLNMPNGVLFSLNKQNRWELPEVIENVINTGDDECNIRYVHRHNCNRTATAIRVAASDGVNDRGMHTTVKGKPRGYFQPESVFRNNLTPSKKRNTFRQNKRSKKLNQDIEPEDKTPQIRYDVITPVPSSNFLSRRSASHVVCDSEKQVSEMFKEENTFASRNRGHKSRKANSVIIREELGIASLDYEDEMDFSDNDYDNNTDDLFENYEQYPDSYADDECTTETLDNHDNYIRVILQSDDIQETNLRQRFGQSYTECQCTPRKFIISMSDKMQEIVSQMYGLTKKSRDSAYLLFVHDVTNDVNTEEQPVYRVTLQCPYGESNGVITTLYDYMYANVEEIVGNTGFYMETLPIETYTAREEPMNNSQSRQIEKALGWSTTSVRPDNTFHMDFFLSGDNQENSELNSSFEIVSTENIENTCGICFVEIDSSMPGTALKLCGHTFCNGCWREYVITSINSSRCLLSCPEFECKSEVDSGTIASFLDYNDVIMFAKLCHDKHVAKRKDTLYCPNSRCHHVLCINDPGCEIAHCRCGTKVCVKCSERAHWPADCDAAKEYHGTLEKTGDMRLVKNVVYSCVYVYGKNCPSCNVFVQKFGGCNQVRCWCGESFCWGCGRRTSECDTYSICSRDGTNDRYKTSKVRLTSLDLDDAKERNPFYKIALQHRLFQNPTKVARMVGTAKAIKKHLCKHLRSHVTDDWNNIGFEHENLTYKTEAEKTIDFVNNTVDLYMELNQAIEYGAVLLWSHEVLDDDGLLLAEQLDILAKEPESLFQLLLSFGNNNNSPVAIIEKLNRARSRITSRLQNFIAMALALEL